MHVPQTEVILRHHEAELARVTLPPGEYIIGRSPDVEIPAETPLLSRRHARLTVNYDEWLIEDLGSANGTFINDQRVAPNEATRVFPTQTLRVGDATVTLRRVRGSEAPDVSLAPSVAAGRELLPEELRERRYAVGKIVAQGGMGAILSAQDRAIRRSVAMKVMLQSGDPGDVARFVEEAQITGQLEHPNIVPVHELGVDEQDQFFYTMKFVGGITLKKVLELIGGGTGATAKKYPLPALLTIFQKVCDALAFAHSRGVIHRDLKPENIMLGDFGEVLVMDWGLAKILGNTLAARGPGSIATARTQSGDHGSTLAGTIMGTPAYMSPEQARGEIDALDARSDIYALGTILFELLHLRPVVTGPSPMAVVDKVARGTVEWVGASPKDRPVPASLLAVCRKALALDVAARYASVEDLQRDLAAYQGGFATSAENAGAWKQLTLLMKRNKAATLGLAAVLLVGAAFGTKAILEGRRAERGEALAQAEAARANRALADLKRQAPGLRQLAETEAGLQRFDSALEKLDSALALDSAHLPSYWRRAWLLIGLERWPDAAAAVREAQRRDPSDTRRAGILPLLDRFAAAPDDKARWTPGAATELFELLRTEKADAQIARLSSRLQLGRKEQLELVRRRLDEWLGKKRGGVNASLDAMGRIALVADSSHGGAAIETLEPLRGLPIEVLDVSTTRITTLEPLRGMPLQGLDAGGAKVADLTPLAGMPLVSLQLERTPVENLEPLRGLPLTRLEMSFSPAVRSLEALRGMPLRYLTMRETGVSDLSPLQGMPLEELSIMGCGRVQDLAPLLGAPLKKLNAIGIAAVRDLTFLRDAPIEDLQIHGRVRDLSPLQGKPLRLLEIGSGTLSDLSPLRGSPIETLEIARCPLIRDLSPLLEMPSLKKLVVGKVGKAVEPLRQHPALKLISYDGGHDTPVAEFWAAYDSQQAAGKK